jgi:hypothetical protein
MFGFVSLIFFLKTKNIPKWNCLHIMLFSMCWCIYFKILKFDLVNEKYPKTFWKHCNQCFKAIKGLLMDLNFFDTFKVIKQNTYEFLWVRQFSWSLENLICTIYQTISCWIITNTKFDQHVFSLLEFLNVFYLWNLNHFVIEMN